MDDALMELEEAMDGLDAAMDGLDAALYGLDSAWWNFTWGFGANPLGDLFFSALVIFVLVCTAFVFKKAGEDWWKAIIPFYNIYIVTKIAKAPVSWFWTTLISALVGGFIVGIGMGVTISSAIAGAVMHPEEMLPALIVGSFIMLFGMAIYIVTLIFYGRILCELSVQFGKEKIFGLGLLFLAPIFWGILAFDDSEYKKDESVQEDQPAQAF